MRAAGFVLAAVGITAALPGCDTPLPGAFAPQRGKPDVVIELGQVVYPSTTDPAEAVPHQWEVPPPHRIGYGLGKDGEATVVAAYHDYQRQTHVQAVGPSRFSHRVPARCYRLSCAYEQLATQSEVAVLPIAQRFADNAAARGLDLMELARMILTWIQNMDYQLIEDDPYGMLPPALVADRWYGDCDSKALLAAMLLQMVGIHAVMLDTAVATHNMVGVELPAAGDRMEQGGHSYAVVEVTSRGWPIGRMPPQHAHVDDWRILEVPVGARVLKPGEGKPPEQEAPQ